MFENLRKKIENNIEVEDLVELAVKNEVGAVPILKKAIEEKKWEDYKTTLKTKKVPLKTWSLVVIAYLESGYVGLKKYVYSDDGRYKETADFVLSVLDDIKSKDTVKSMISLFYKVIQDPSVDRHLSNKVVSTINRLLSFKPYLNIDVEDKEILRVFLVKYLSLYGEDYKDRSSAFCALRGVGDLGSIDIIKSYPKLKEPYKGLENMVIKVIKSRNN